MTENKYLKIGVKIKLLTDTNKNKLLSILEEYDQKIDSQTEIFASPKDLPYFGQYGNLKTWGAVSNDILFSSIKILSPDDFMEKISKRLK